MLSIDDLIQNINGHKIVKDFDAQFAPGQVDITTVTPQELQRLTITLYNKVLFIGTKYESIYNAEEKNNYYNYFHVLFNKLKDVCVEIDRRNALLAGTIALPIQGIFTQKILTEIITKSNAINAAHNNNYEPHNVLQELKNKCVENSKNAMDSHITGQMQSFNSQLEQLNNFLKKKWVTKLCFQVATESGLKFYRAAGTDEALENQAKNLAVAFLNQERPWYKHYFNGFFRSKEERLYDTLKEFLTNKAKNTTLDASSTTSYTAQITQTGKNALFSLKGTAIYEKITGNQPLDPWEKVVWQKRLVEHLQYSIDGVNPFLSYSERTAKKMQENSTITSNILIFTIGIILCPIIAPITKEYFKDSFVAPLFNALNYITKPVRWVLEKAVIVPIEAPFKLLSAISEATFQRGNFNPNSYWFGRILSACKTKTFFSSTLFHGKYQLNAVNQMISDIKSTINNNKINKAVILNIPQKQMQKTPVNFAAKVMVGTPGKAVGNKTTAYDNINPNF